VIHKWRRLFGFVSADAAVTCPVCRECDIYIYIYIYIYIAFFGHLSMILFTVLKFYAIISLKKE